MIINNQIAFNYAIQAAFIVLAIPGFILLSPDISSLSERISLLEEVVADLRAQKPVTGPPGPQGEQGPSGERGPRGKPGEDAILPISTEALSFLESLATHSEIKEIYIGQDQFALTLVLSGLNLQITNGLPPESGSLPNGSGNLIIGYNKSEHLDELPRSGSHNLVVGDFHSYTSQNSVVFGSSNSIIGDSVSILGGRTNQALNQNTVIVGGASNEVRGDSNVIVGGAVNVIRSGSTANVIGGGVSGLIDSYQEYDFLVSSIPGESFIYHNGNAE